MENLIFILNLIIINFVICPQTCLILASNENHQNTNLIYKLREHALHQIPPTSILTQFKNDDLYWTKWLEVHSFKLNTTCTSFEHHLKWRERLNMDTIHLEDWSYFLEEYPAYIDSVDKIGRPITEIWFSDWNPRKAVITGRQRQLVRWMIYISEMGMRSLFQGRANGKNISGGIQLIDYSGFNMITHGCPSCLQMYNRMKSEGPQHYPGIMDEIYILNIPLGFNFLLQFWKDSLINEKSKQTMKMYDNRKIWGPLLHSKINRDQLGTRFGGTKDRRDF